MTAILFKAPARVSRLPWLACSIAILATALWFALGPVPHALVYDRVAIADGELWRLVTGHLVHCDARHALSDIGALLLVASLIEWQRRARLIFGLAAGFVAVNVMLWFAMPTLERYCGLSGILNSLIVLALADSWAGHRHPLILAAAGMLMTKLGLEIVMGQSLFIFSQWPGVPLAHIAGCVGGLIVVLMYRPAEEQLNERKTS